MNIKSIETSKPLLETSLNISKNILPVTPAQYKVLNPKISKLDVLSLISASIVFFTNLFGGTSLLYDQTVDRKKKHISSNIQTLNQNQPFNKFESPLQQKNNLDQEKEVRGAKTIVPTSEFAKKGIAVTKFGIAMTSIAGILNGISMGVPLQSFGDAFYFFAVPIIETPIGLGLMSIGLGSIFAGRALQLDPRYVIDKNIFKGLPNWSQKTNYIVENISKSYIELIKSTGLLLKKVFQLFTKQNHEAVSFFKDNVFSSKSKIMLLQEYMNKDGKVFIKKAFKTSPYFMQAASFLLIAGGATLVLASLVKNKLAQHFGLRTLEVGGVVDTVSGLRWGLEKASIATDGLGKFSGNTMALGCLVGTLGQPGLDEKWGRGLYWLGNGLIYLFFALERVQGLKHFIKNKGVQEEFLTLLRQWEVDLRKILPPTELKKNLQIFIDKAYKNQPFNHPLLDTIDKTAKEVLSSGAYIQDHKIAREALKQKAGKIAEYISLPDTLVYTNQIPEAIKKMQEGSRIIFGKHPESVKQ